MMNLTLNQYIQGLEDSAVELPKLLAEWDTIHEYLQEEYAEQLRWLLDARTEALQMARIAGRYPEIVQRIEQASHLMADHIAKLVDPETLRNVECAPNGLQMAAHRFDGWSFECEDGDHQDYLFPVVVEFVGTVPPDVHEGEYAEEQHALIYSDGFVALTLYECCYFIWSVDSGNPLQGFMADFSRNQRRMVRRVSQASRTLLQVRCPPKKPWGIRG